MTQPIGAIAVVGGNSQFIWRVMQCLALEGRKAFVLTRLGGGRHAFFRHSRFCLGLEETDLDQGFRSPREVAGQILSSCRRLGIGWLIPADLQSALLLAALRSQLHDLRVFPSSGPELIRQLADKLEFSNLLSRLNLPQPTTRAATLEPPSPWSNWQYPLVVKPINGEGGWGVKTCQSADEAIAHVKSLGLAPTERVLVQEFIPGLDVDLSLLADSGKLLAWTIQQPSSRQPRARLASCRFLEHPTLLELGRRLVEATGYSGIAHIDARIDERDGTVKLLECNPRVYNSIHMAALAGVNFIAAGLALAAGEEVAPQRQQAGIVNMPLTSLKLLFRRSESLSVWSRATGRAWRLMLRDPWPWFAKLLPG